VVDFFVVPNINAIPIVFPFMTTLLCIPARSLRDASCCCCLDGEDENIEEWLTLEAK
jgi:hypothetical protein